MLRFALLFEYMVFLTKILYGRIQFANLGFQIDLNL